MTYRDHRPKQYELNHEVKIQEMHNKFALKMCSLICASVVSTIILLGIFFGDTSIKALAITGGIALLFGILTFRITNSALC
jgi:hypothetical protein